MIEENKINSDNLDKFVEEDIKDSATREVKTFLHDKNIAISVSECEDIEELGFSKIHQQDIILELTRYLIINGATLIYGGDLRAQGYTFMFSEIVEQYIYKKENKKYYKNFFSFPIYLDMTQKHRLDFKKNGIKVIQVEPPETLDVDPNQFYIPNNNENILIWTESLTKMRKEMNVDSHARIFMGGTRTNFKGKYPGIFEEALISLESGVPTYFIGAFGGITKSIISALLNEKPEELTEEWQRKANIKYSEFINFYNVKNDIEKIDYAKNLEFLNKFTIEKLCKNNGLDEDDNKRLFETIHLPEIIYLILKGLKKILNY
ncbi:hypothetical protein QLS31_12095 [Flavobacterium sp. XS2P24]|uniref:hypothetical protein n=1 Tax=Flavobacterium sp. XS2P24 TaxID=3041249 RepID=UPI0024A7A536|nr:hypothetical protein [Flavobacterium sp. XS2P24]MDI6050573.1 hypothetical protein [Flavobacterium sp. XS2P24]